MAVLSGDGPPEAKIMLVGEAFGETEERTGTPFAGASGLELNRILHDAGILRSECYATNLVNARPPANNLDIWIPPTKNRVTSDMVRVRDKFVKPIVREGYESLLREIALVKPELIIALGGSALWALTGQQSIVKWRGSLLDFTGGPSPIRVLPTYHPAAVLRQWEWRNIMVHDLRRARRELIEGRTPEPQYNFLLKPSFGLVVKTLRDLTLRAESGPPLWLDFDIETVCGHIRCFGLSWSREDALCIPLMSEFDREGYWMEEEEGKIIYLTYRLMTHPNVRIRGQNLLYDFQYTWKHWHFVPTLGQDTMISHHCLWAGMPKSLAFQASMYSPHYIYWKDLAKHDMDLKAGE